MAHEDLGAVRLKLALVAGGLMIAAIGGVIVGRASSPAAPAPVRELPPPSPEEPPLAGDAVTEADELGRADLIRIATAAATEYATDQAGGSTTDDAVGRQFKLRIPFGCRGPAPGETTETASVKERGSKGGAKEAAAMALAEQELQPQQTLSWRLDPAGRSARLTAQPAVWTEWPLLSSITADKFDTVEGFWIPRPWVESESCPAVANGSALPLSPAPPRQTVGLAQFYSTQGSRLSQRKGRPYEVVKKLSEEEASDLSRNYRLVLEGRIVGYPDHRAAHCASLNPDQRPVCLVAVEFEKVAFEDPRTGAILANWSN